MDRESLRNPHETVLRIVDDFIEFNEDSTVDHKKNRNNLILSIGYLVSEMDSKKYDGDIQEIIYKFLYRFGNLVRLSELFKKINNRCHICFILTHMKEKQMKCFRCMDFYHATYNHEILDSIENNEVPSLIYNRDFHFKRYPVELLYAFKFRKSVVDSKQKHIEYFKKYLEEELIATSMHPKRMLRFITDDVIDFDAM